MKPEFSSLHCSENPVTGLYSEPYESSQHFPIKFKSILIYFRSHFCPWNGVFLPLSFSHQNPVFTSVMHATCPKPYITPLFDFLKCKSGTPQCNPPPCGFVLVWRCSFYSRKTPALRHACLGAALCILHLGKRWSWRSNSRFPPGHNPRHSRSCSCFERGDANMLWATAGFTPSLTNLLLDLPTPCQQPTTRRVKV